MDSSYSHSGFVKAGILAQDEEDYVDLSPVIPDYNNDTHQLLGNTFVITPKEATQSNGSR
jgi:hypothetical protein